MSDKKLGTRRETVRMDTDRIQPGSWVEYVPLNVGERFKHETIGVDVVKKHIKGWNFADSEGEPLPQPQEGVAEGETSPFDLLNIFEYRGLTEIVAGFYGPQDLLKN